MSVSRQAEYRRRHAAEGLCRACGEPAVKAGYCATHKRKPKPKSIAPEMRGVKCDRCGVRGHPRTECKEPKT